MEERLAKAEKATLGSIQMLMQMWVGFKIVLKTIYYMKIASCEAKFTLSFLLLKIPDKNYMF